MKLPFAIIHKNMYKISVTTSEFGYVLDFQEKVLSWYKTSTFPLKISPTHFRPMFRHYTP